MFQNKIQLLIFTYFLIPTFQFTGFLFINLKVLAFFGIILFLVIYKFLIKLKPLKNKDIFLFSVVLIYISIHIPYSILTGVFIGNSYFYIKILSGIILYFLIIYSDEEIDSKIWYRLIVVSIFIAFLQQFPYTRTFFMAIYGSVQGYISDFPYSRASGITVGFYIYTQVLMLFYLIYSLSVRKKTTTKKFTLFVFVGSLLSNTRSTFLLPFYYLFLKLKLHYKIMIGSVIFMILLYLVENFAPIKVIYHHLFLVYESGDLSPIINSQNSSFAQRVADIFWFFDLIDKDFYQMLFWGLGSKVAEGQEIGYFLVFTKVGIILTLLFYFMPLSLAFYYLKFKLAINFLILILPILLVDFLVSGFVKYDLYILYWVFTAFYIKHNIKDEN